MSIVGLILVTCLAAPCVSAATIGGSLAWAARAPDLKAASPWLPILVRFRSPPSAAELARLEQRGLLRWRRHGDRVLGATTVFLARTSSAQLAVLAAEPALLRVEADGSPVRLPTLDVTAGVVGAPQIWRLTDSDGVPLTGVGVRIADLDSGVDPFHPALLHVAETPVPWHDEDGDPLTGAGGEWADLDGDGVRDAGETLRVLEAPMSVLYPDGNPPGFTPGLDWVWADTDGDGRRDRAPADGWSDASPSLGEPLLVARDGNGDGLVTAGEDLLPLTTPKVERLRDITGHEFVRGVDLTQVPDDPYRHGTPVAGILVGGMPGLTRLTGIAPGAELLTGVIEYDSEPRFWRTLPEMAAWAAAEDADVLLIEDGEWVWEFMDGSSAGEVLLEELARDRGIVVLTAAGNLAGGGQHDRRVLPAHGTVSFTVEDAGYGADGPPELWLNFNWRGPLGAVHFELASPAGSLDGDPGPVSTTVLGGAVVEAFGDTSPAGTAMLAMRIRATAGTLPVGDWRVTLRSQEGSAPLLVDAAKWDSYSGWTGYWQFRDATDDGTVTWPGSARHTIVVGAFDGRGMTAPQGTLNSFSGRGTDLAGRRLVDLAAPGSITFSISQGDSGWRTFSGTSAALPHVAGACALLRQAFPMATPHEIELALAAGARADADTGQVPNSTWGFGKLDIPAALDALRAIRHGAIPVLEPAVRSAGGRVTP